MISPIDLGWLAGIVDGKSSIHGQIANKHSSTGGNLYFEMRIEATSFAMIERVSLDLEAAGIQYRLRPTSRRKNSTKDIYSLSVYRRDQLEKLLALLLPVLVVKAEEAKAVLEWYKRWQKGKRERDTITSLKDKEAMVIKLKSLKQVA
jgi:hypothetical protein